MKLRYWFVIAMLVGVTGYAFLRDLPGLVIIDTGSHLVEMRIAVAVILALFAAGLIVLLVSLIKGTFRVQRRARRWLGNRNWRRARRHTIRGMVALAEGRWRSAEEAMLSAASRSDTKLLNYLVAAQAAQEQDADDRRDHYLRLAHQSQPDAQVAVGLTQAQLQLKHGQYEHALATLQRMRELAPEHPFVLKLLFRTYQRLQEFEKAKALLPSLIKHKVMSKDESVQMEAELLAQQLQAERGAGAEQLQQIWNEASAGARKNPVALAGYCRQLIARDCGMEAERLLREALKKDWHDELVRLYGLAEGKDKTTQLNYGEGWLKQHNQNAVLLLTLGRLAARLQLWGKAQAYLQQSLKLQPSSDGYMELAEVLEQMGHNEEAMACYKDGLGLLREKTPPLGLPHASSTLSSQALTVY